MVVPTRFYERAIGFCVGLATTTAIVCLLLTAEPGAASPAHFDHAGHPEDVQPTCPSPAPSVGSANEVRVVDIGLRDARRLAASGRLRDTMGLGPGDRILWVNELAVTPWADARQLLDQQLAAAVCGDRGCASDRIHRPGFIELGVARHHRQLRLVLLLHPDPPASVSAP